METLNVMFKIDIQFLNSILINPSLLDDLLVAIDGPEDLEGLTITSNDSSEQERKLESFNSLQELRDFIAVRQQSFNWFYLP